MDDEEENSLFDCQHINGKIGLMGTVAMRITIDNIDEQQIKP
jgi:hypothetical protein